VQILAHRNCYGYGRRSDVSVKGERPGVIFCPAST